jgi:asparagine synthetase B (glutamine-hydrolysing)
MLDFPAYWGAIANDSPEAPGESYGAEMRSRAVWRSPTWPVSVWIGGNHAEECASWNSPQDRADQPAVFIWGSVRIASDSEFGKDTTVETFRRAELADRIATLYERMGTSVFALLEGSFSLVLFDPSSHCFYLVVDKLGCDDICYRVENNCIMFASHPALLPCDGCNLDPLAVSFFLAQEGFVPAPFTLLEGIRTIGRSRFLRIMQTGPGFRIEAERYWRPSQNWKLESRKASVEALFPLLAGVVESRLQETSGLLLSGGTDSSLLLNIASRMLRHNLLAVTGRVKGYKEGERELTDSQDLASGACVPHEQVVIDPEDDSLPEEWRFLTESWMGGARLTTLLFDRLGAHLQERLGAGYVVLSGQLADTLADNNYTLPLPGYTLRRAFYSPWFLRLMPFFNALAPAISGRLGARLSHAMNALGEPRFAGMLESVLNGLKNKQRFYEGRLFGFAEMPGRSRAYIPLLTQQGFEAVAEWYSSQFIKPVASQLTPATFHRDMIEMSMDMVMLHLDTRLPIHVFRLRGGRAELPFMDSRVVNFFASIPRSARSIFRESKYIIRAQFRQRKLPVASRRRPVRELSSSIKEKTPEALLINGALGAHFRDLLCSRTAFDRVPRVFEYLDERYVFDQLRLFCKGSPDTNAKFISRLAALETWSQFLRMRSLQTQRCTIA